MRSPLPLLALGAVSAVLTLALLCRRRSGRGASSASPGKIKSRRAKKRHNKKSEDSSDRAPVLEPGFASECYSARKVASTVTAKTVEWLVENAPALISPPREEAPATSAAAAEAAATAAAQATSAELANLPNLPSIAATAAAVAAAKPSRESAGVFAVLSVGCGDGELDLELIMALSNALAAAAPGAAPRNLHYVGLEPTVSDATAFTARIEEARQQGRLPSQVVAYVRQERFDDGPKQPAATREEEEVAQITTVFHSEAAFDLVVCAGTMSYFRDTPATVGRMLAQTKSGGRLLIVQPSSGVPELQGELMKMARGNEAHLCSAEQVKHLLSQFKLPPFSMSYVTATLSCTECLLRTPTGLQIISHCLECDVRRLCEHKMMRILKAFWRAATIDDDGSGCIEESHAVFLVDNKRTRPLGKK